MTKLEKRVHKLIEEIRNRPDSTYPWAIAEKLEAILRSSRD